MAFRVLIEGLCRVYNRYRVCQERLPILWAECVNVGLDYLGLKASWRVNFDEYALNMCFTDH